MFASSVSNNQTTVTFGKTQGVSVPLLLFGSRPVFDFVTDLNMGADVGDQKLSTFPSALIVISYSSNALSSNAFYLLAYDEKNKALKNFKFYQPNFWTGYPEDDSSNRIYGERVQIRKLKDNKGFEILLHDIPSVDKTNFPNLS